MLNELTEAEKQITEETRELLVSLDEKQKELTEYQTNIVNIRATNIFSRERRRNHEHVSTVTS
jgi:spore coat polysaccharide biosynthesis predicted glycosyltransferase SpsG